MRQLLSLCHLDAVGVGARLGGDAQHALGTDDDATLAVLEGAAAPTYKEKGCRVQSSSRETPPLPFSRIAGLLDVTAT